MNDRIKAWKQQYPEKVMAMTAKRRAQKLQAMPKWVATKQLLAIYTQAKIMTKQAAQTYHVDHIVPLQHPMVCGLHVPWNLQILTAIDNLQKSNSWNAHE